MVSNPRYGPDWSFKLWYFWLFVCVIYIIVAIVLESEYNSYNIIVSYTCKSFIKLIPGQPYNSTY